MARNWVGPGLLPMGAYVFSADCSREVLYEAYRAKDYMGDLVQICRGVDDQIELDIAIAALLPVGGKIVLSEGSHNWSATPTYARYVTIEGQGRGTIITPQSDFTPILLQNLRDVTISNFTIDAVYVKTNPIILLLSTTDSTYANPHTIKHLFVDNCRDDATIGIRLYSNGKGVHFNTFDHIYFKGHLNTLIQLESNDFGINGNYFNNIIGANCDTGIDFVTAAADNINNNFFGNIRTEDIQDFGVKNCFGNGNIFFNMVNFDNIVGAKYYEMTSIASSNMIIGGYGANATDSDIHIDSGTLILANHNSDSNVCSKYVVRVALTGALQNAIDFAWQNPHSSDIFIDKVIIDATTASTLAASLDAGFDADGTGAGTDFFDDVPIDVQGTYDSTIAAHQGQQVAGSLKMVANGGVNDWLTGMIRDASGAGLVGFAYIYYTYYTGV